MSDIIDLNERRNAAERPDAEFIHKDDFGREMFCFALSYEMGDATYGLNLWAYDMDDAKAKVAGIRESLRVDGQIFCTVPA